MKGEEVRDELTLSRLKTVESMIPVPADNQLNRVNPKIGEKEYKIIEECLQMDGTIEQACMLAGISVPSYYKHREKNPDFARRMDIAKQFPKMIARAAIQKRIRQGDSKTALEYLKLRDKFYKPEYDVLEEGEQTKRPVVQFISVASKEGANNDSQNDTKQKSAGTSSLSSGDEKMTPRENEEQALRNLDSLISSNG